MIEGKRVLALITARGGSKGIVQKNIRPLAGKPLIHWTIEAAQRSRYIDRLILSSDCPVIIDTARQAGCEVPFVRPGALATDTASSMAVILHALDALDERYDYLLLLQPTSPFRTAADIDGILAFTQAQDAEVCVSVSRVKKHPMFLYRLDDGRLESFFPQETQLRRQDMPAAYEHNGALYVATPHYLRTRQSFNRPEALGYVTEGDIALDIDTAQDWEHAECVARRRLATHPTRSAP